MSGCWLTIVSLCAWELHCLHMWFPMFHHGQRTSSLKQNHSHTVKILKECRSASHSVAEPCCWYSLPTSSITSVSLSILIAGLLYQLVWSPCSLSLVGDVACCCSSTSASILTLLHIYTFILMWHVFFPTSTLWRQWDFYKSWAIYSLTAHVYPKNRLEWKSQTNSSGIQTWAGIADKQFVCAMPMRQTAHAMFQIRNCCKSKQFQCSIMVSALHHWNKITQSQWRC